MRDDKKRARLELANAIVKQLWVLNYITAEERDRIIKKNENTFLL